MSTTGGALMAARSVLSHSLKWVRCLLPHQGTHLPLQHPTQTPRCSSNPFLEQWLPVRVVQTRHGSFSLGNPKTPPHTHAVHSSALKHTWDISSLPVFCNLGLATFTWGDPASGVTAHWKTLFSLNIFFYSSRSKQQPANTGTVRCQQMPLLTKPVF